MKVNVALIGCGRIGERHADNIIKAANLTAVCDIDPERAIVFAEKYGAKPYFSVEELLENERQLVVAAICTPNWLHATHSIQCSKAGLHVLCEKPLCIKVEDGLKMIATASMYQKDLFVVKQNRFNPPVVEVKKLLDGNKLGKIFSFQVNCFWNRPNEYYANTWKGLKEMDGGTLFTQFSHFIDVMYWMLGDVKKVTAIGNNFNHPTIEFEDSGAVIFEMKSGVLGTLNYNVNSFKKNMEGSITIFGEKGTVKIGGQYLNELEYQSIDDYEIQDLPKTKNENDYGFYKGSMSNHDKVYENLLKAIKKEEHTLASAEDGLKTVEIIENIYKAMQ